MKLPGFSRATLLIIALTLPVAWLAHQAGLPPVEVAGWRQIGWLLMGAPLIEEIVFRWLLQRNLEDFLAHRCGRGGYSQLMQQQSSLLAQFIAAVCFALAHLPRVGNVWIAAWFIPGLALAEIWRRERSLWLCVLAHAWFNAVYWLVGLP